MHTNVSQGLLDGCEYTHAHAQLGETVGSIGVSFLKLGVVFHNGLAHGMDTAAGTVWEGTVLSGEVTAAVPPAPECPGEELRARLRARRCLTRCARGGVRGRAVPVPMAVPIPAGTGRHTAARPGHRRGLRGTLLPRKAAAVHPTLNFCGLLALCK